MRVPVGIVSKTPRAASVLVVAKVVVDGARRSQLLRAGLLAVVGIDQTSAPIRRGGTRRISAFSCVLRESVLEGAVKRPGV